MDKPNLEPTLEELDLLDDSTPNKDTEKKEPVKAEKKEAKEDVKLEEKEDEPSPMEIKARDMGWRPKEEFEGDPDTWVDAGEFVRRKPLFDEIHKNKRKANDLEKSLLKLKDHYDKVRDASYKQAIEDLKAEKLKALEDADHKRVVEIDDEIAERRANAPAKEPEPNPEFDEWVDNNSWYLTDKEMRWVADRAGKQFISTNPDASRDDIYEYAETIVKKKFPDKLNEKPKANTNKSRPSPVDNSNIQSKGEKSAWDRLSREDQSVVADFIKDIPGMTKEQYAKDLLLMNGEKI